MRPGKLTTYSPEKIRSYMEDMVEMLSVSIRRDIDREILRDLARNSEFKELHPKSQECSLEEEFFERISQCQ